MLLRALKSFIRSGSLTVTDSRGRVHVFGNGGSPRAAVKIQSKLAEILLMLRPELYVGKYYAEGILEISEGDIYSLLEIAINNLKKTDRGMKNRFLSLPWARRISQLASIRNVRHHYDLSRQLFELFLDRSMQYSCAYFRKATDSLEVAQQQKMRHIAAKLCLDRPGLQVLDIGSGWGGLAEHLARQHAADVTGITLSEEQLAYSSERIAEGPDLAGRVRYFLRDYRKENGRYDRIVSVGMFEHVGRRHYREFFEGVHRMLSEDGVALVHTVGFSDPPGPFNPYIQSHIFPGAEVPSLSEIAAAIEPTGLVIADVEVLRVHYAETLHHWRARFLANIDKVRALYDDRFCRMWDFYLAMSEIGFRYRTSVVFQIQLAKRNCAVPLTRDYIGRAEQGTAIECEMVEVS